MITASRHRAACSAALVLAVVAILSCAQVAFADHPPTTIPKDVVITNLKRVISVRTNIEEQISEVKIKNTGTTPLPYFLVAIPPSKASHLAIVEATLVKNGVKLQVSQVSLPEAEAGAAVFQVQLKKPLSPEKILRIEVKVALTHTLVPYPATIRQSDSQFVEYKDYTQFYSPHTVLSQATAVKLASNEIESYSPKTDAKRQGDTITFGPYGKSHPWTLGDELYVHSENNHPFATLRTMEREIEISHWGNVAVTENSVIEHTGAKLEGSFSRSDYQSHSSTRQGRASFRSLLARLPLSASDIYFRDHIGNISTSTTRRDRGSLALELQPRYPMFGGWKADLEFGYNLPASEVLSRDAANPEDHVLDINFGSPFPNAVVDELTVKVILPEGSSNIRWSTPFDIDDAQFETRLTYLDFTGRPVLVLKKRNVVPWHQQKFSVAYSFPRVHMAREPGLLIAAIFALLAFTMLYVRLDFSFDASAPSPAQDGQKEKTN